MGPVVPGLSLSIPFRFLLYRSNQSHPELIALAIDKESQIWFRKCLQRIHYLVGAAEYYRAEFEWLSNWFFTPPGTLNRHCIDAAAFLSERPRQIARRNTLQSSSTKRVCVARGLLFGSLHIVLGNQRTEVGTPFDRLPLPKLPCRTHERP